MHEVSWLRKPNTGKKYMHFSDKRKEGEKYFNKATFTNHSQTEGNSSTTVRKN